MTKTPLKLPIHWNHLSLHHTRVLFVCFVKSNRMRNLSHLNYSNMSESQPFKGYYRCDWWPSAWGLGPTGLRFAE